MFLLIKLALPVLLIGLIILTLPTLLGNKDDQFSKLQSPDLSVLNSKSLAEDNIKVVMGRYLKDHPEVTDGSNGTFAIYINSLKDSDKFTYNENEVIESASLYKLIVLASILKYVEAGNINFNTVITSSIDHLASEYGGIDSGYENSTGDISYTIEQAMERVAQWSDNFASIMLTDEIFSLENGSTTDNPLADMARDLGMNNTDFSSPYITTTASDIDLYFEQVYAGHVIDKTASAKILDLLTLDQFNNRIPALLPKDIKVSHKTGDLDGILNDAGIVYPPRGQNYIIVLMGKDINDQDKAIDMEAKISKAVYDYFASKAKTS